MMHVRRAVACASTFAVALLVLSGTAGAADTATTAANAVTWLKTQQQPDGGFEVSGFPGFETRDASLAIAEQAQTGSTWSTTEAHDALAALPFGGSGPTPLNALDAYAATITTAGAAAKTIVLSAGPLGIDPAAFDAAGDGGPVNLEAMLDSGCGVNTASFGTFSDTLYAILAKKMVCGAPPPAALAAVRAGQQANGGWNFTGDPTGTDVDTDTTAVAVEGLVAGGADATDPAVHKALGFFATNLQSNGSWLSFGASDPNSTAQAILGVTATGYDVTSPCWRDVLNPAATGTPYVDPDAWLESQQLTSPPADAGRIASPNDAFPPVNTFATSQSVEGLLRSWLPIAVASAPTCVEPVVPVAPVTPVVSSAETTAVAVAAEAVTVLPAFTG
jgi:hypothetical protein